MNHKRQFLLIIIAILCLILFAPGFSVAQRQRMSVDDRVKHLTEQLSLSTAQADSVRKIYEASDKARDEMFQSAGNDRSAMRDKMRALTVSVDEQIKSLLKDDQKVKYDRIKKERPRGGERPQRPPQH